ncbi:MAG: PstS family phosphate ABC transporter substrate-binding protein [Leptolyngbyaceae cyanobacterium CRU_2_3]|nr:PstS family phosphate ABC transporter substrate-binding protein [Leptolyngbyaceae cyanobacterium CRU_2_3]
MVANGVRFQLRRWKLSNWRAFLALAIATATLIFSAPAVFSQTSTDIKIDGSSTVYPITEAVAEEFQKQNSSARVTVGISGTGGGFKKFCNGEIDISNASRPIKQEEIDACKAKGIEYIELPVAYDALTVVVNRQNSWVTSITTAELKKMWEPAADGKVMKWNQVRSSWPDAPLNLYGPGTDSGTFDYFTEAINGKSKDSRTDFTASEDDNVLVQGVVSDRNALGYFGYAYYEENQQRLRAIPVDGGNGAVAPNRANVENGSYTPLSRPLFIYVSKKSAERADVKQFIQFYLNNTQLVSEVGYVPLPNDAYAAVKGHWEDGKIGTVFANRNTVGIRIPEILQLEAAR